MSLGKATIVILSKSKIDSTIFGWFGFEPTYSRCSNFEYKISEYWPITSTTYLNAEILHIWQKPICSTHANLIIAVCAHQLHSVSQWNCAWFHGILYGRWKMGISEYDRRRWQTFGKFGWNKYEFNEAHRLWVIACSFIYYSQFDKSLKFYINIPLITTIAFSNTAHSTQHKASPKIPTFCSKQQIHNKCYYGSNIC